LFSKYQPESKVEKKTRLTALASAKAEGKEVQSKKPYNTKYALNHITALIEAKKAQLVLIAHDVDPIEVKSSQSFQISHSILVGHLAPRFVSQDGSALCYYQGKVASWSFGS